MADQKLTALTALAALSADDLFYVVDDPAGAATSRKLATSVLDARFATAAQGALAATSLQPADIGATVQGYDADLATIAGLAKTDGNFIVGDGAAWVVESGATARASLGLVAGGAGDIWVEKAGDTMTGLLTYGQPSAVDATFYRIDPNDADARLFNWNLATSSNLPDDSRNNVVINWGYNQAGGGGASDGTDSAFYQQLETHYPSGGGNARLEYHWDFFTDGADPGVRPMHLNMDKDTGLVDLFWYTDTFTWLSAHDGNFGLMAVNSGATALLSELRVYVPSSFEQELHFTGTTIAGLRLNNLTTTQQDALTPVEGMLIYNTTAEHIHGYINGAWTQVDGGGGGGTPGGADTQIQFNDGGAFGGDADLSWNKTSNLLTVTGSINVTEHYQIDALRALHFTGGGTFVGSQAGNLSVTGVENTGVGGGALLMVSSGENNVAVGSLTLADLTTGSDNVAIGRRVLQSFNGSNVIAIGTSALAAATTAAQSVAIGVQALQNVVTAGSNTAVGYAALKNVTGANNTALGDNAGVGLTTGVRCTFLGVAADATSNGIVSSIALGYSAKVAASYTMVIGSDNIGGDFPINQIIQNLVTAGNAVQDAYILNGSAYDAPVAGHGVAFLAKLRSTTTTEQLAGRLSWEWATATHASRKARSKWTVYDTAVREAIRIEANGSEAMVGFLGAAAVVRQAHIADPSGGGTTDAEARTAINAILLALEGFGFLATS